MALTVIKDRIGKQDLHFDTDGSGASTQVRTSTGGYREVSKLNASHIPVTTATRAKKYADGSTTPTSAGDTDVDAVLEQVLDDLEDLGQPDSDTLTVAAGVLKVADAKITATQLATDAVETAKIKGANVTNAKLAPASGTAAVSGSAGAGTNVIEAASIDYTEIADDAIRNDQINTDAVNNDSIADDAVSLEHLDAGITFSDMIVETGTYESTAAASDTFSPSTATLASGDLVFITPQDDMAAVAIAGVVINVGSNQVTVHYTGAAAGSETIGWMIVRAAS